jgi:hypothetical protein
MGYTISVLLSIMILLSVAPVYPYMNDNVGIEIISDEGMKFLTIPHKNFRRGSTRVVKRYLEAIRGKNYSIAVRNNTAQRLGVVIAVDGRNIISGNRSDLGNSEMMYIVNPYNSTEVDGWRTDSDTVHRFLFTDENESYSVRTFSDASAMGVIAVAVFREKEKTGFRSLPGREVGKDRAAAAPEPAAGDELKAEESASAGTGFGGEKHSPTVRVKFVPERNPFKKVLVKYEWHEVLCNKGLLHCPEDLSNRLWDEDEYAPYPPGYHN